MSPPLTVVIPTHGRPDLLVRTLASLAECALPAGYAACVVAENGGRHGAEAACAAADPRLQVRYLYHEQGNKSATLNRVLEDVSEGLMVFFDDDVRLSPGVLAEYAAAAETHGPGHWFAGPLGVDYEQEPPEWLKAYLPPSVVGWEWTGGEVLDKPAALGANWAAWAENLRELDGFDAGFGPGSASGATGQERDMLMRLLDADVSGRYVADARVWHYVPATRCTPRWALDRAAKNAADAGRRTDAGGVEQLCGYPRWLVRHYLTLAAAEFLGRPFRRPRDRFQRRLAVASARGQLRGAYAAADRDADLSSGGLVQTGKQGPNVS